MSADESYRTYGTQETHGPGQRLLTAAICALLAALTLAVFGRTLGHEFVNYDDGLYVSAKLPRLTGRGIAQAFTRGSADNWDPLTTLSHMADCQLYGLKPAGHHLTNVLLHAAAAVLLFLILRQTTRWLWPSAFVAAVFAIHPLHVESVAWVAERKDVLSAFFFMLTLLAYARYVQSSKFKVQSPTAVASHASRWYWLCLICFALGLMSKPMLVTLPFVLLLLDYWPLRRVSGARDQVSGEKETSNDGRPQSAIGNRQSAIPLIREKIPFFLLSILFCAVTLLVQLPSMSHVEAIPLSVRLGNALVSCVIYLWQTVWPANLAVFYPYPPGGWPLWQVAASALVLGAITAGAFAWRRQQPWLLVGWLWYLVMLVPVIGLVQVGFQARADRYTYLPQIGLYLALAWTVIAFVGDEVTRLRLRNDRSAIADDGEKSESPHVVSYAVKGLAVAVIAALSVASYVQAGHWRDSEALWRHALACTANNATAHNNLGAVLVERGRLEEAAAQYQKALELRPDAPAHNNLGSALLQLGRLDEAVPHFRQAVALDPRYVEARGNLGIALSQTGQLDEAIGELRRAIELQPDHAESHYNLGLVLSLGGRVDEAITHLQKAVTIEPADAAAHANLGKAFATKGRAREAVAHFEKALELQPDNADTGKNFAWLLATCPDASVRNGPRAVELAEKAVRFSGGTDPAMFGPLAAAYAEVGRFSNAVTTAQQALKLAVSQGNEPMAEAIRKRIEQYQAGTPTRDPSRTGDGQ